ncbi:hypothetical protein QUF74_17395 [Candidatus Halobeggiatoa sp. HSG11]|nr:hypothetical protein [Candidatus Halobeggiatoa sp. HSG11]
MSKKKKSFQKTPISAQKADDFLAKGKYKEATDAYKKLLKTEQRQEWQDGLAKAYLLRAKSLAKKGMYKEAVVLWENRANIYNDKESFEQYIHWLIKSGSSSRAINLLTDSDVNLPKTTLQQLMVQFGVLFFENHIDIKQAFSQDTPLVKHYKIIEQALAAYYQNDKKLCEEYINQIPFRSPYRDFCLLLKSLLVIDSNQNLTNELLAKIPSNSPYAKFASLVQLAIEPYNTELLDKLAKLSSAEQQFVSHMKGWNKQQFKAINILKEATSIRKVNDKIVLEILINNRQVFGEKYVQNSCMAILPNYINGIKLYEKIFTPLSKFDKNRIFALHHEQQDTPFLANKNWQICVDILKQNRKQNSLKIALILRHQADFFKRRGEFLNNENVPEYLIQSLDFDPNDKESYLNLTKWYKKNVQTKSYYQWSESAVKQLPQDSDILFVAMEAAIDRKSFKKALKYAVTLLKIDPINIKARYIARNSHIAHAQKLIKNGKYPLAHKELEEAAQFEKATKPTGIIQINQGLLELQEQGFIKPIKGRLPTELRTKPLKPMATKQFKEVNNKYLQPIKLLQEGVQLAGGGLLGLFKLMVDSKKQNLDCTKIYPLIVKTKTSLFISKTLPTQHEILELVNLINIYAEEEVNFLNDLVEQMKEQLQPIVKVKLLKDDMLSLCQCIKRIEHHELLKTFATHALKQWKQQPAFTFYLIYGVANGNVWHLSENQVDKLEIAIDNAKNQGDERTAIMIAKFIEPMYGNMFPKFNTSNLPNEEKLEAEFEKLNLDMEEMEKRGEIGPNELAEVLGRLAELGIDLPVDVPKKRRKK